jgi:predicted nucleic acid-binding protein
MRLAIDASVVVAEALRTRGRQVLMHPGLDLALAQETWEVIEHELHKRIALLIDRGILSRPAATQLLDEVLATVTARVNLVPREVYADRMEEARQRIPRDQKDAPVIALALALHCGIWTADHDFFGCGMPVWITETLRLHIGSRATQT